MAENCQYCGGRLKKLHPAHETFCSERPRSLLINGPAGPEVVRMLVKDIEVLAVTNQKTVTNTVTTPRLVTLKNKVDKLTRAEKAKAKRASTVPMGPPRYSASEIASLRQQRQRGNELAQEELDRRGKKPNRRILKKATPDG